MASEDAAGLMRGFFHRGTVVPGGGRGVGSSGAAPGFEPGADGPTEGAGTVAVSAASGCGITEPVGAGGDGDGPTVVATSAAVRRGAAVGVGVVEACRMARSRRNPRETKIATAAVAG
jgi:hypothetical protein